MTARVSTAQTECAQRERELRAVALDEFDHLSVRVFNKVTRAGSHTLGDVLLRTESQLIAAHVTGASLDLLRCFVGGLNDRHDVYLRFPDINPPSLHRLYLEASLDNAYCISALHQAGVNFLGELTSLDERSVGRILAFNEEAMDSVRSSLDRLSRRYAVTFQFASR